MEESMLSHFKELLEEQRRRILANAADSFKNDIQLSPEEMPDENDLASALSGQAIALRLRDRERGLLRKINAALVRIKLDDYGYCDACGDEIDPRRLEARPVTTMCIECKEASEKQERSFVDERTRAERSSSRAARLRSGPLSSLETGIDPDPDLIDLGEISQFPIPDDDSELDASSGV